jgi:hypothetical protein
MGWEEDGTAKILSDVIGLIGGCRATPDCQGDVFLRFNLRGVDGFPPIWLTMFSVN